VAHNYQDREPLWSGWELFVRNLSSVVPISISCFRAGSGHRFVLHIRIGIKNQDKVEGGADDDRLLFNITKSNRVK
jgi:hypothetical protein